MPTYHILLVDDDLLTTALLVRIITHIYGQATISVESNGADAWHSYQQRGANLLITDNVMPYMSGLELARRVRAHQATLPIVMLSGTAQEEAALAAGVTRLLLKPVSISELTHVLISLLPP